MKPIHKVSVTDQTVEKLKELIQTEGYQIGDRLPTQAEIGAILNIGRSAVREAIRVLEAEGVVEVLCGKGVFIINPIGNEKQSAEDWYEQNKTRITDFVNVRGAMEPLAIKLAMERATPEDMEKIHEKLLAFERAMESGDPSVMETTDYEFHKAILETSRNQFILNIMDNINWLQRELRRESFKSHQEGLNAQEGHRKMYDAMVNSQTETAVEEMRMHVAYSRINYLKMLKNLQSKMYDKNSVI